MTQLRKRLIDRVKEAGPFAEPSEVVDALNLTELVEAADALTIEFDMDYRPDKDLVDRYRAAREKQPLVTLGDVRKGVVGNARTDVH